jgi:RNA polymerase sigma-70 factor (sigma-E family)
MAGPHTEAERVKVEGDVLEELFERHSSETARLAYLLTGDREVAEDLAQEAFLRMAGRFVHVRRPDALHAYLRTTVVNLARSHHRRRAVARRFLGTQRPAETAEPDTDLGEREALRAALLDLSPRQRTAVVLRYYEDLDEAATAAAMGCATGTVKSLASRGVARLRERIGDL